MTGQKEIVGFLESCRLCLRNQGTFNIFSDGGLLQDIREFTGITVHISNNLPQLICRVCWDILKNIKQLREVAARNDMSMKYLVSATHEVKEYEHNQQVIVEENSSSVYYSTHISSDEYVETYVAKIEDTTDEDPLLGVHNILHVDPEGAYKPCTDGSKVPEINRITVRSDLFSKTEVEQLSDKHELIKPDPKIIPMPMIRKPKLEKDNSDLICSICKKQFVTWKKLNCHIRLHKKSFSCSLDGCEKKFSSKSDLEKHFRIHTGVKPYQCELCSRRFTQNGSLKSHKETVHKIIMSANQSQKCPKIVKVSEQNHEDSSMSETSEEHFQKT